MIVGHLDLESLERKRTDQPTYGRTQTGYGRKIPTDTMVRHNGKWRRVYVCCYSNAGTAYITQGKDWIVIR